MEELFKEAMHNLAENQVNRTKEEATLSDTLKSLHVELQQIHKDHDQFYWDADYKWRTVLNKFYDIYKTTEENEKAVKSDLISAKEASGIARVSRSCISSWVAKQYIKAYGDMKKMQISLKDLKKHMKNRKKRIYKREKYEQNIA